MNGLLGDYGRKVRIERDLLKITGVLAASASSRTGRVLVVVETPSLREARDVLAKHVVETAPPVPSARDLVKGLTRRTRGLVASAVSRLQRKGQATDETGGAVQSDMQQAWHARPAPEVAQTFGVDLERGFSADDARAILHRRGPNVLAGVETRSSLGILAGQVFTVPNALLLGAAGLSLALGDFLDAGAIGLVITSSTAVGYFTELRAEELLHAWGNLRVEWARVVRDGREQRIAAADIVPGDVLVLGPDDAISADARIHSASDLTIDESTLTGESEPVEKTSDVVPSEASLADRRSMVYAGTIVASGSVRAVVVATGRHTELGNIQRALSRAVDRTPPLEQELAGIGRRLALLAFGSAILVTGVGFLRRIPVHTLLRSAVALGVAAVPEGFPAVGTTAQALASHRLRSRGIVIRRLSAAETLGAVSVVCADKTGTLTENRMRVAEVFTPKQGVLEVVPNASDVPTAAKPGGRRATVTLKNARSKRVDVEHVHDLTRIAALNANVELNEDGAVAQGSGTERALVEFALAAGYPVSARRRTARRLSEERRAPDRPFMVTVHDHPELGHIELVKGAPEQVIAKCGGDLDKDEALRKNSEMAARGLRVLALAWRQNGQEKNANPLALAGLIGLRDPTRPGVREALATLSTAGITTLMLTGDQERTALAIGEELGIPNERVHSRVTPEAKLDIVSQLEQQGSIVAMTGDGVNDGPALKAADVGVAMGKRGTDIARAVADVVLAEDDLPSLIEAVREGRRLHDNIRRAISYFVSTNLSEVMVMLAGAALGIAPLTPLQLLWINLLTDVAPALALALEPAEPDTMVRPPRDPEARLFEKRDLRGLVIEASKMAGASIAAYSIGARRPERAGTMAFTALVTAQLLHVNACRARVDGSGAERSRVGQSLLATSALQALALGSPSISAALGSQRVSAAELAIAIGAGLLPSLARGSARDFAVGGDEIVVRKVEKL